jgi:hypothetical protein
MMSLLKTKPKSEGYCVKCRTKRQFKAGAPTKAKNGSKMVQGTCPECSTTITVFVKK